MSQKRLSNHGTCVRLKVEDMSVVTGEMGKLLGFDILFLKLP